MVELNSENLIPFGLSPAEATTYLALLKAGPSVVSRISQLTGQHRTNIYDTLEKLKEKGLASFYVENGVKKYRASDPETIIDYIERKKQQAKNIIPMLKNISLQNKEIPDVQVFKGESVVKMFHRDIIRTLQQQQQKGLDSTHRMFGADEKIWLEMGELEMKRYWKALKNNGLKERILVKMGSRKLQAPSETTHYKEMPADFFEPVPISVYGDKVSIFMRSPVKMIIQIQNSEIAIAYRKYFEYLWNMNVTTLIGMKNAFKVYEDIYKLCGPGDEALCFGASSESDIYFDKFENWERKLTRKGVKVRIIFSNTQTEQIRQALRNGFEVRTLPKSYASPVEVNIYAEKVALVIYAGESTTAHIMQNRKIVDGFKHFFEIQWKAARPVRK